MTAPLARRLAWLALFAWVLVIVIGDGFSAPADAQIHTWRDRNGNLVLSDRPRSSDVTTVEVADSSSIRSTRMVATAAPRDRYQDLIEHHARRVGVRPGLVRAVIQVESGFDALARSAAGAMGLMQLMPATELRVRDPFDPNQNIRGGTTYLRQLLDRYDGNEELALAAYNAGSATVREYGEQVPPYPETRDYVERVRAVAHRPIRRSRSTIYKTYELIDGRRIPRYSNIPSKSGNRDEVSQGADSR